MAKKASVSKTALITGATSGIGAAYAERFAKEGYSLILTGRRKKLIMDFARRLEETYGVRAQVMIAETVPHCRCYSPAADDCTQEGH